ncbi:hypothetical protein N4T77_18760 [Clostridium sp. CX1]|uniref:Uncharacterized protein n=1 Tax=Clostridium tanneri TaxID=3037988 RepID=A0ABU4JXH3_9CLOT|nr:MULTISPECIES: hypothetical protein [unclassified Clostridium]MCT8978634.1 hypothetical protein [Clostridium sp. CX1]MDW8802855.1 hypothetical protein [Clostridium sp. A1-XYC3]
MVLLVVVAYALIAIYEFLPLYKQKQWRDFQVNSVLFFLSFVIAVLLCFKVHIPSPAEPIKVLITSVFGK